MNLKLQPVTIKGVEASLNELEPGERYELEVALKPPFASERIRTNLVLETGLDKAPTVKIPLYATVIPRVAARPARIVVPLKRPKDWKQSIQLVWDEEDVPYKIVKTTANDPALTVTVDDSTAVQYVLVQVTGEHEPRSREGSVIIETDDPDAPKVRVPVTFRTPRQARKPARNARSSRASRLPRGATRGKPKAQPTGPKTTSPEDANTEKAKPEEPKPQQPKPEEPELEQPKPEEPETGTTDPQQTEAATSEPPEPSSD